MPASHPQLALTFHSLYSSPLIAIDDYVCRTSEGDSRFTDAFRKEFGCAPSELRRKSN